MKWSACTRAKLLQLCPTLCDPMDRSPPGSSVQGILQARTLEWAAISLLSTRPIKKNHINIPAYPPHSSDTSIVYFSDGPSPFTPRIQFSSE